MSSITTTVVTLDQRIVVVVAYALEYRVPFSLGCLEVGHGALHIFPQVRAVECNVSQGHSVHVGILALCLPVVDE